MADMLLSLTLLFLLPHRSILENSPSVIIFLQKHTAYFAASLGDCEPWRSLLCAASQVEASGGVGLKFVLAISGSIAIRLNFLFL